MKKILAGVLAAATMLSVSATAFATSKNVTKPGEVEYEVAVSAPKIVLSLVMPAKMTAALNPYGAEIKLSDSADAKTSKLGIVSPAYTITNNSKDYGVYIDATAVTKVKTKDETPWKVTTTAVAKGTKAANLMLAGYDDEDAMSQVTTIKTASAAATASEQGVLVLNSDAAADPDTGAVAGQTSQKKAFYVAAADAEAESIVIGFLGKLAESDTGKEVEWTEDDSISVDLVLKVTAGPKTFPTAG